MVYDELQKDLYVNRDERCANDVAKMAELGRFGEQIIVYGTAAKKDDDKIYYHVTTEENKMFEMIEENRTVEMYFTPMVSVLQRFQVPAGMEDKVLLAVKYSLLSKMKKEYEGVDYFNLMEPFFKEKANNSSYPILNNYRKQIEGNFDDFELQKFTGLVKIAYDAKVLDFDGYNNLMQWHKEIRRQMEDDPVVEDNIGRTLYGFIYLKKDKPESVFDAREITVLKKRQELLTQGYLTGPVIKRDYWFQQFHQFNEIKNRHQQWLLKCEDENFFNMLFQIKQLKGVIDIQELAVIKERVANSSYAYRAVNYFEHLWNKA